MCTCYDYTNLSLEQSVYQKQPRNIFVRRIAYLQVEGCCKEVINKLGDTGDGSRRSTWHKDGELHHVPLDKN